MDNGNQLGKALGEYREARKWTLQHLARLIGVSPQTVANIIGGKTKPSVLTRRRILDALPHLEEGR